MQVAETAPEYLEAAAMRKTKANHFRAAALYLACGAVVLITTWGRNWPEWLTAGRLLALLLFARAVQFVWEGVRVKAGKADAGRE